MTCRIDVLPAPERKTSKNRPHLEQRADGDSTAVELSRAVQDL